jgi:thymidylate synthase (FAD)
MRERDLEYCLCAAQQYARDVSLGMSEEHARGKLPFDYRQHFVVSFNLRSLLHFLDLRNKKDAQLEIQEMCALIYPHVESWVPEIARWYRDSRWGKARLSP